MSFDVVVAGAGPAGAVAATVLARAGRRVLLAGANDGRRRHAGESLPPAARPLLRALGAGRWEDLGKDRHLACLGNLSVWGSTDVRCVDFLCDPNGAGWILDRAAFDAALVDVARAAGAEVRSIFVKSARRGISGHWRVGIEGGWSGEDEIGCRFVIDASGRRAAVARRLVPAKLRVRDRLIAFTVEGRATARSDPERRTLVEAVPDGWWYTSIVPGGRRVFVYLTDADLAPRGISRGVGVFESLLEQTACVGPYARAFRYKIDESPRAGTARTGRLEPTAGDGWAAAGDAALALDPLSSRGLLTAIWSGTRCGEAVNAWLGGDAGAMGQYGGLVEAAYREYLREQVAHYQMEGRWADRVFWARRQRGEEGQT